MGFQKGIESRETQRISKEMVKLEIFTDYV
jgi:hypothetical protein